MFNTQQQADEIAKELNKWAYEFIESCVGPEVWAEMMRLIENESWYGLQLLVKKHNIYWVECPQQPYTKILVCGKHKGVFNFQPKLLTND